MTQPNVAGSPAQLLDLLRGIARVEGERLVIEDEAELRGRGVRDLAWTATFSQDPATVEAAQWIVWEAAQALGIRSASIHSLYMARGRGEVGGFTVPAMNLRTQVFDMARTIYETALRHEVGPLILELARSEQEYTYQRPAEYVTNCLAGAIAAGWSAPVFVQGDHFQFNARKYASDPEGVTESLRKGTREALAAGYGNIDIDSSTLVVLSRPSVDEQQRTNYERAAELAALIRHEEHPGLTVSIGGEIGEVGKQNSTEPELRAFLDGFRRELDRRAGPEVAGLSKVSIQTGTSHGGVPLPDGRVALVKVDFDTIQRLSAVCRSYGLAGAVQHGASTLPDELFHRFPEVDTAEIHLATGFQNTLYDHPATPRALHDEVDLWVHANCADERTPDETDQQFVYKTRKKALGPLKRRLWELETKDEILATQAQKLELLFHELRMNGTRDLLARYIDAPDWHRPLPEGLRAAVTA
ncbi:MAG: class II fructose-bisphosphate aldolase [Candidatus Limnocylindrales bacterium]